MSCLHLCTVIISHFNNHQQPESTVNGGVNGEIYCSKISVHFHTYNKKETCSAAMKWGLILKYFGLLRTDLEKKFRPIAYIFPIVFSLEIRSCLSCICTKTYVHIFGTYVYVPKICIIIHFYLVVFTTSLYHLLLNRLFGSVPYRLKYMTSVLIGRPVLRLIHKVVQTKTRYSKPPGLYMRTTLGHIEIQMLLTKP